MAIKSGVISQRTLNEVLRALAKRLGVKGALSFRTCVDPRDELEKIEIVSTQGEMQVRYPLRIVVGPHKAAQAVSENVAHRLYVDAGGGRINFYSPPTMTIGEVTGLLLNYVSADMYKNGDLSTDWLAEVVVIFELFLMDEDEVRFMYESEANGWKLDYLTDQAA